ncbi:MAG: hypothetical protein JWN79_3443 [Gemmatimonadetes bacterium]|jgi:hypothetical protein|nr:hypothetical protein [Gemmatimonadota bacterium]
MPIPSFIYDLFALLMGLSTSSSMGSTIETQSKTGFGSWV